MSHPANPDHPLCTRLPRPILPARGTFGPARWKKPRCNGKGRKTHHWKVPFFVAFATFLVALSQTERPQLVTIVRGFMSYISDARIMKGAEGICGWHEDDVSHLQKPTRSYITTTSTWTGHSGEIKPSYVYLLFTWASPEIKTPKYLVVFFQDPIVVVQLISRLSGFDVGAPLAQLWWQGSFRSKRVGWAQGFCLFVSVDFTTGVTGLCQKNIHKRIASTNMVKISQDQPRTSSRLGHQKSGKNQISGPKIHTPSNCWKHLPGPPVVRYLTLGGSPKFQEFQGTPRWPPPF